MTSKLEILLLAAIFVGLPDTFEGSATIDAVIYPRSHADSVGAKVTLEPFQKITTSSARRSHSFSINKQRFLAVVSFDTQCDVYRFKASKFVLAQQVKVSNANAAKFFEIDGQYFLAIAKFVDGTQYATNSPVLKWNNATQKFENFQKFKSIGGFDFEHFSVKSSKNEILHFLALANAYDGIKYSVNSTVYLWNASQKQFEHFQDLATEGAHHFAPIIWQGNMYLAVANYVSKSVVYKLKADDSEFELYQSLPGTDYGSWASVPVYMNGSLYLIDVIYEIDQKYKQKSPLFVWKNNTFVVSTTIPSEGTTMMCPFTVNKGLYLVLSNYFDGNTYNIMSSVDQVQDSKTVTHMLDIATHGSYSCHTFEMNGTVMVMFSNSYDDKTTKLDSIIYKVAAAEN
ncbi:thrombospondin-type laminin G domain and EAR repeat-containing protein-like [Ptychodera flava]|uniref:thrombospondin-type laminin G domain and EAR repeat-containing protein-like n=1 Tax=Ptychodera flava TaxID=63121 RepID=UPI00396A8D5F